MDMFVTRDVFYEAVDEDDDAARGTGRRVVGAGVEGGRLGTGEPGFGEALAGHRCVALDRGVGETKLNFARTAFLLAGAANTVGDYAGC